MFIFGKFYENLSLEEINDIESRHSRFEINKNNFINKWYNSDTTKKTIWSLYKNKVLYIEKLKDKDLYEMNTPEEIKEIVTSMPTTSQLNKRKLFDFINGYLNYCMDILHVINLNSCDSLDPDEVCKVSEKALINKLVSRDKLWDIVEQAKDCIESNCIMPMVLARFGINNVEDMLNLKWSCINREDKIVTIIDKDATFGVIGVCGINGNLISRVLMDHGFKVQANDMVNEEDCRFKGALADYPDMKVYYGKIPQTFFTESDYMVLPMALIESKSMIYQKVKKHNIPVLTPNDIFEMFEPKHPVICITGTNGKSTTTNLLKHIAYAADMKPCEHNLKDMQGNTNDIPALQSRLAGDLNILETGTFGVKDSLYNLAKPCDPDVGIITNITPDHIAEDSTFLDYAMVKGELIRLLDDKTLIVNSDDPTIKSLINKLNYQGNLITFGVDYETSSKSTKQCFCGCDVEVDEFISGSGRYECSCGIKYEKPDYVACDINDEHNKFTLLTPSGEKLEFSLSISGLHNIYNATGAIIAAIEVLDLNYEVIADAVASFGGVAGRMQKLGVVDGKDIMIDYAHNPAGISTVLSEVKNSYGCVVNVITTESESGMEGDHEILENALEYADFIVPASYNSYLCAKEALKNGIGEGKIILPDEMSNFQKEGTTGASQHQVIVGFMRALDIDCDLIICTGEAAFKYEDVISDKINSINNN